MQRTIQLQSGKIILNPDPAGGVRIEMLDDSDGRAESTATPDQAGTLVDGIQATLALEPV